MDFHSAITTGVQPTAKRFIYRQSTSGAHSQDHFKSTLFPKNLDELSGAVLDPNVQGPTILPANTHTNTQKRALSLPPDEAVLNVKKLRRDFSQEPAALVQPRPVLVHLTALDDMHFSCNFTGEVTQNRSHISIALSTQDMTSLVAKIKEWYSSENTIAPPGSSSDHIVFNVSGTQPNVTFSLPSPDHDKEVIKLPNARNKVSEVSDGDRSGASALVDTSPRGPRPKAPHLPISRPQATHRLRQFQGIFYRIWNEAPSLASADIASKNLESLAPQSVMDAKTKAGDIYQLTYSASKPPIFWIVDGSDPAWIRVEAGHPHPVQLQYVLSVRKEPHGPSWVKKDTWRRTRKLKQDATFDEDAGVEVDLNVKYVYIVDFQIARLDRGIRMKLGDGHSSTATGQLAVPSNAKPQDTACLMVGPGNSVKVFRLSKYHSYDCPWVHLTWSVNPSLLHRKALDARYYVITVPHWAVIDILLETPFLQGPLVFQTPPTQGGKFIPRPVVDSVNSGNCPLHPESLENVPILEYERILVMSAREVEDLISLFPWQSELKEISRVIHNQWNEIDKLKEKEWDRQKANQVVPLYDSLWELEVLRARPAKRVFRSILITISSSKNEITCHRSRTVRTDNVQRATRVSPPESPESHSREIRISTDLSYPMQIIARARSAS
ncbi:hypothetical protein SISNIDRAFT_464707 [Sistotremastrum niveocremeum HHB9708]|uniref:Uncharacterized protein n=1 Tax=Sistotremastrum niveocremeum HHB9708 TaxID=1314777 RepID=A0A164WGT3_9AGAM|nr:hypothetical protein SISNIDRAFT_464707 [Sistotremastrum niveocremeum HHB9708]